jgi:hypothetical protein
MSINPKKGEGLAAIVLATISVSFDFVFFVLAIFVAALLPVEFSGGKFITDSGCFISSLTFVLLSLSTKIYMRIDWKIAGLSLSIPAVVHIWLMPIMNQYWIIRLYGFVVLPIILVMLVVAFFGERK